MLISPGFRDEIRDALHSLAQHVVGHEKGLPDGRALLGDFQQVLVRDRDQRVDFRAQPFDPLFGELHFALAFEIEGLRHHGDGERAHLARDVRHHRGGAGARPSAHARGDKDHVGTLQEVRHALLVLECRLLPDLRDAAGPEPARELRADREPGLRVGAVQRLLVRVDRHERDVFQTHGDHAIDGVASAAAHTDDLDDCRAGAVIVEELDVHVPLPFT